MKVSTLSWKCFVFIETVLLLYSCGFFMSLPVQRQFIYSRYSQEVGFPFSLENKGNSACEQTGDDAENYTLKHMETKVQELSSRFVSLIIPCQFLPCSIMGLFIGPWTDTAGRKPALLGASLGAAVEAVIMLSLMIYHGPLYWLLVGKVLNAMTGFFSGMAQISFAYVFDTTDHSLISTRLAVLQLVIFTGGFLGQAFSGVVMTTYGFVVPYIGLLLCFISSFTYCLFIVPESRHATKQETRKSLFNKQSLYRVLSVFSAQRPSSQRKNLFLLIAINSISFSVVTSGNNLLMLYLIKSPICLSTTQLGGFFALKFACEGLGGVVGVGALKKFLTEENAYRAGLVSLSLSNFLVSYVHDSTIVYLVPLVSSLCGVLMPLLKGAISKLVEAEEQGATTTAVSVLESLSLVVGSIVFNKLYIYTTEAQCTYMVFVISGLIILIPIAMISALQKPKKE